MSTDVDTFSDNRRRCWWLWDLLDVGLGYLTYIGYRYDADKLTRIRVLMMLETGEMIQKAAVAYYSTHRAFATSVAALGVPNTYSVGTDPPLDDEDPGKVVFHFELVDGRIVLMFAEAQGKVAKQSIILTPSIDPTGAMSWSCTEGTVPATYRPQRCRASIK